jgi:N-acyl-L-homoserine lactone synthetase
MKRWVNFMNYVLEFAKDEGCKKMEMITRPGWEKVLKSKGFFKTQVQLEKVL